MATTVSASLSPDDIEVPYLVGVSLKEARYVLQAAGLVPQEDTTAPVSASSKVTSQTPCAGEILKVGDVVALGVKAKRGSASAEKKTRKLVVCIDPGHQTRSDMKMEPIGPKSKTEKPRITGGTTGVSTGMPEYEVALQISMNVKRRLENAGVKVVMTRTTNDVYLSNAERAAVANKAHADLFLRVHADGNPDPEVSGISTLYPTRTKWTYTIAAPSKQAARFIQDQLIANTKAIDRGIHKRKDLAGFNHSRVPAVLIECGFMSNDIEDRLLASPHYQDEVAKAIVAGSISFLGLNGK